MAKNTCSPHPMYITPNSVNASQRVIISKLFTSTGTKYQQEYVYGVTDKINNVKMVERYDETTKTNEIYGIRMEDFGMYTELYNDVYLIMIADGHGAQKMIDGYYCGGYEAAKIAVIVANILFKRRFKSIIGTDNIQKQGKILSNIYKTIQTRILDEMNMNGVYIIPAKNKIDDIISHCSINRDMVSIYEYLSSLGFEILFKRDDMVRISHMIMTRINNEIILREDLEKLLENKYIPIHDHGDIWKEWSNTISAFDGDYFEKYGRTMFPSYENINQFISRKGILIEKNIFDNPYHVPIYLNEKGEKVSDLDSGTTLTTCLIYKENDKYCLLTGHVGDSHAFILRERDGIETFFVTDDHSVNNKKEVERCDKEGLIAEGPYFYQKKGGSRGLMPSRALGHPILSNYGISIAPHISKVYLEKGDIVIVGSDGLWDLTIDIPKLIKDNHHLFKNATVERIGSVLLHLFNMQEITDNVSFYVIKIE